MKLGASVLLVGSEEGRRFFEGVRKRVARHDDADSLDGCMAVPVGSEARFAPWLKLLHARQDKEGLRYLVAADGARAAEMRESFREAGVFLRHEVLEALRRLTSAQNAKDPRAWRSAVDRANSITQQHDFPLHFLRLDLAESALERANPTLLDQVAKLSKWDDEPDRHEIMRRLGAKGYGGKEGLKDINVWTLIGESIRPSQMTANVRQCIARWFAHAAGEERAREILRVWTFSAGAA